VNYNYRRNILHDRIYWWDIGSKFIEWRFSFQCDIAISIRNLARSQRCGKLSRVLREAIVTRYASTFAFNCVCKRILGQVSSTRHFDGRTSDVKDISHMYDVTSALYVRERNLDVRAVKVEVSSLIFALLAGLFSLLLHLMNQNFHYRSWCMYILVFRYVFCKKVQITQYLCLQA